MYLRVFFKKLPVLLFGLILSTLYAQAAVTFSNASSNGAFNAGGVATLTFLHQINPGGLNKALFVGVSTATTTLPVGASTNRVAGVTYNGVALTRIGTAVSPNSLNTSEIFRLVNPPEGNFTVEIALAAVPIVGNAFVNYVVGGAISFEGVSQSTPNGAFFPASGNNASPTVNVTDSVAGDFVLDTLGVSPNAIFVAPGANQTERWDGQGFFGNAFDVGAGSTEAATSASTTMSWLMSTPENWALGGVTIKQSVTTSAEVTVTGRVILPSGKGVPRAQVRITGTDGQTRTALTNFTGHYRFVSVTAGESYIFNVSSKFHSFNPQILTVNEDLYGLNFIALP